jgi:hypothetical protein
MGDSPLARDPLEVRWSPEALALCTVATSQGDSSVLSSGAPTRSVSVQELCSGNSQERSDEVGQCTENFGIFPDDQCPVSLAERSARAERSVARGGRDLSPRSPSREAAPTQREQSRQRSASELQAARAADICACGMRAAPLHPINAICLRRT